MLRAAATIAVVLLPAAALTTIQQAQFQGTVSMREIGIATDTLGAPVYDDPQAFFDAGIPAILERARASGAFVQDDPVTIHVKGPKIRYDLGAAGPDESYMIIDYEQGVFQNVTPAEETYVEWSMAELQGLFPDMADAELLPEPPYQITPIGASRTVSGRACTGYRVETDTEVSLAWVTRELDALTATFRRVFEASKSWLGGADQSTDASQVLLREHGFPMLNYGYELDTGELSISEVAAVEPAALPDSLFAPPAGYKKMTMQEMMEGMRKP